MALGQCGQWRLAESLARTDGVECCATPIPHPGPLPSQKSGRARVTFFQLPLRTLSYLGLSLPDDFGAGEEEGDFVLGVVEAVGAVHGVCLDRFGEVLADRAGGGVGGG